MKELEDEGMKTEGWHISDQELRRAIKMVKQNKATDESGIFLSCRYTNPIHCLTHSFATSL